MNVGRLPTNWTLYGVPSFSTRPVGERGEEHVELEQRRVLQHAERPFVRVRNDGNRVVPENGGPPSVRLRQQSLGRVVLDGLDDPAIVHETFQEGRGRERRPVGERTRAQCAVDSAVVAKNAGGRIAERRGFVGVRQATRSGVLFERDPKKARSRCQYIRTATATPAMPPSSI